MNRSVARSSPSPTSSAPPQKTRGRSLPPPRYAIALADAAVQRVQVATGDAGSVEAAARHGIGGAGGRLPHFARVQRAFGRHDLSGVVAHTDGAAREGARAMGALAYTHGDHVAFAATPTLHTVAHEAAHVIQQRAGVRLVTAIAAQPVVGGAPTVVNALQTLLNLVNPNFLATEYGNAVAALTDPTLVARDVVRSTGFATHPGTSRGFAFEDRAEVRTSFPNLTEGYNRVVAVVDRY